MINICTKYGFDILIISGSYGGHRRHTTDDGRRTMNDRRWTTPRIWHKLPTGELKKVVKYKFGAKRRIKLNFALTIDQNYILYYNYNKIIYYIFINKIIIIIILALL